MNLEFNDKTLSYKAGDGLRFKEGISEKHKISVAQEDFVELVLFESE